MPGFIYADAEGGLISVIIPDDEKELLEVVLHPGEALMIVPADVFAQATKGLLPEECPALYADMLQQHTGKIPPDSTVAVLDKKSGVVIDVVCAYPSVFAVKADYELKQTTEARVGDKYVNGKNERVEQEKLDAAQAAELEPAP